MNAWQLQQFDHLLNTPESDWQLYYWITGDLTYINAACATMVVSSGREDAPPEFDCEVLQMLQRHCQEQKHMQNQQPHITPNMVYIKRS